MIDLKSDCDPNSKALANWYQHLLGLGMSPIPTAFVILPYLLNGLVHKQIGV